MTPSPPRSRGTSPALVGGVALALAGCVGKGRFDEVVTERDACGVRVSELEEAQRGLETDLAGLSGEVRSLERALEVARSSLADKEREAGTLAADVDAMRAALEQAKAREAQVQNTLLAYRDLVDRLRALIDAGALRVKVVDGRMLVEMATDVLFDPGQASVSASGRDAVLQLGRVLAGFADREFQVAGHTDDTPIQSKRYPNNWALGAARAIAVVDLLTQAGVPGARLSAASYAETRPAAPNRTDEGRAANRRIEVVIVPDLSSLPGYAELQSLARQP